MCLPVDCIDQISQGKKVGQPLSLRLRPNFDLMAELKSLQIYFLDDNGEFATADFSHGHGADYCVNRPKTGVWDFMSGRGCKLLSCWTGML
jgi:hypothetical protein